MNKNLGELLVDRDRLRNVLKQIADHHDGQRAAWNDECADADNAGYHEDRRNFALFHLALDDQRPEIKIETGEEPREETDLTWIGLCIVVAFFVWSGLMFLAGRATA